MLRGCWCHEDEMDELCSTNRKMNTYRVLMGKPERKRQL
jgi:hypothetical protein